MKTRIHSNLKNLTHPLVVDSPYIFIKGDNASGKSAIVHSVEWALTGYVADAAGRDIKSSTYVDTLACGPSAEVEVVMGNGTRHTGKNPSGSNVIADTMSALTGTSTALVSYMLEHGAAYDGLPVDVTLDYSSWDHWVKVEGSVRAALRRIQKAASKALSKARGDVREAKIVLKYGELPGIREMLASALTAEAEAKSLKGAVDAAAFQWLQRVAPHISPLLRFYFIGKEVRIGLNDPEAGPVPSGAELVEVAIHLSSATRDPATALYVLPDRAYDTERLAHLLRVLRTTPCLMAIVQSPIDPHQDYALSKYWSVLEV